MKDYYLIPVELIDEILDVLSDHWFSDGGSTNNKDVIQVQKNLEHCIKEQQDEHEPKRP